MGSASQGFSENSASWLATAPTRSPHTWPAFSKRSHRVNFSSEGGEPSVSGGGEAAGVSKKGGNCLTHRTQSNHNKPTANAQSCYSASPPGALAPNSVSPKPRERAPHGGRAFNLGQGAQWKVLLLVMAEKKIKKKKKRRKKITLLKIGCLSLGRGEACKERAEIRCQTEVESVLRG